MKVLPFKIPKPNQDGLVFQIDNTDLFYDKLHQHEEIQISLIIQGEGTLIVGDSVKRFTKNNIFVIGSHLPHIFKSDPNPQNMSLMHSLFFSKSSFGKQFFDLEELRDAQPFFNRAKYGFKVTSKLNRIKTLFNSLENASKFNRFLILLELLNITAHCSHTPLTSFIYDKKYSDNEGFRMRNVLEFTMNNFNTEISLNTIADVSNMTKNAFCKYFKKRTNKTYFRFLNELRVEHACKLLISNPDYTITQIAELSGFNNISNFNRQFMAIKKKTPSNYRKN